ncbi:MAG: hypothetical protein KF883_14000 [Thermomicrobiales bacterium]|nr:hypothetical protein [Thermomicrobiales bacterium]MCC6943464.1 hypothetical protein [Thermomicrobiales bacterium]
MESVVTRTFERGTMTEPPVSSLVERLMTIHHGTRDGYYEILADHGSLTYLELAAAAGTSGDAALTWLETQVSLGVILCDARRVPVWERRYQLPAARASFLLDLEDPFFTSYSEAA